MNLDQLDWLPRPVWFVVASGAWIWMLAVKLGKGKGPVADLLSPVSQRMRERVERREEADRKRRKQELREVLLEEDAPEFLAMQRRIEALDKTVQRLEGEIAKLRLIEDENTANRDMSAGYLRYDADYHIRAGIAAAEQNIKLPEHRSYTQWCRDYLQARGKPTDRRWDDKEEG